MKKLFLVACMGCLALRASAFVDTNSDLLPPLSGEYVASAPISYSGFITIADFTLSSFSGNTAPPGPGAFTFIPYNAIANMNFITPPFGPASGSASAAEYIEFTNAAGPIRTFNTEMLAMDIAGLPAGARMRESPTLASTGQTTITDIGGGLFRIDSFFDVFTELSLDNGNSWIPNDGGAMHLTLQSVPEPGTLTLVAFGLAGFGWVRHRKHQLR